MDKQACCYYTNIDPFEFYFYIRSVFLENRNQYLEVKYNRNVLLKTCVPCCLFISLCSEWRYEYKSSTIHKLKWILLRERNWIAFNIFVFIRSLKRRWLYHSSFQCFQQQIKYQTKHPHIGQQIKWTFIFLKFLSSLVLLR